MNEAEKTKQQINEYSKEIDSIRYKSIKTKVLKSDIEIERLTN
jgi:transposase